MPPAYFIRRRALCSSTQPSLEDLLDLVQDGGLLVVHMLLIACASATNVVGLFLDNAGGSLGNYFGIVRSPSSCYAIFVDVASSSTSCGVRPVTLVASWAFAHDFAVSVWGVVWSDVGGTWDKLGFGF